MLAMEIAGLVSILIACSRLDSFSCHMRRDVLQNALARPDKCKPDFGDDRSNHQPEADRATTYWTFYGPPLGDV